MRISDWSSDVCSSDLGARQVTFNGLDNPQADGIPDFVKALDVDHARDGEVMVAWAMNGADLPFLNGYQLRLVVPGHYGTYWIKHLHEINVVDAARSEEHTSELQSLLRISYAVFCLKNNTSIKEKQN